MSKEDYDKRRDMARQAAFEERFTVAGLLLAYLDQSFATYIRADGNVCALYEALDDFKKILHDSADMQVLQTFAENRRRELERCMWLGCGR